MSTQDFSEDLHPRDNGGRFATKNHAEATGGPDALRGVVLGDALIATANTQAAEAAVSGSESLTAARSALWRTVLWSSVDQDGIPLDNDNDGSDDGDDPEYQYAATARRALTPDDIDPDSKARVEAHFETWVAENADTVKTFTETVIDPDGGDPAEFLAHNWWLTKNGHGVGFRDRLADDPAYVEAVREQMRRQNELGGAQIALNDAYRAAERANSASSPAEQRYAEAQDRVRVAANDARATPLSILREKTTKQTTRYTIHSVNPHLRGTVEHQLDADSDEEALAEVTRYGDRATIWKREPVTYRDTVAENALVRAEALTALDKATPTSEYDVYIGDDGKVHVY